MTGVSIIEDHPVFRHGLASVVEETAAFELVSAHRSVEDFDAAAPEVSVVVLDLHLPGLEGSQAVAHLTAAGYRVLVVSASVARHDVLAALGAGAVGYLGKDAERTEILQAIEAVANNRTYLSPTLASYLLDTTPEEEPLTAREREILELVAEGASDKSIARELGISLATVHSHLDRIRDKTGRRRRADLTRLAFEKGIVKDPDP
jgi:DNA-binding NarL/FixJ family response regulator